MPADDAITHALDYADRWLAYRRWRLRIPGVQVAVRVGGELVLDTAYGVADASTGEALSARHRFRIASHSKSLAALAAMRLVDEGRLQLDDEAQLHVPALAGTDAGAMLVRELLSHGAGAVRDGDDVAFWHLQNDFPDADGLLAIARSGTSRIPASTEFKYSNIGFGLLGLIIEAVSGSGYAQALQQLVARPLGLEGLTADLAADDAERLVTGHSGLHSSDEREVLGSPVAGALAAATGAVASAATLSDALRSVADADDRLLSAATRRRMRQRQWTTAGRDGGATGYGLGLMLREVDGREWAGHGGAWTGQATRTLVDARRDVVVSVFTNAIDGPAEELAVGVARIVSTALEAATDAPSADELDRLRSFEGSFASIWGRVDVAELGGRLLAISPTAPDPLQAVDVLEPQDDDRVRITAATGMGSGHEFAEAQRDASGRVVRWRGAMHLEAVAAVPAESGASEG
ncbi:CubicO group peptidase, beta-lactamase class C family [Agrococcus baldri]|uniref:CubicO group peptidase, beta-lactamase class C family n=1 Tax=Agrococcus baldri TaxID=153730 RepID=A0AA94L0V5_9MICO|nr:serine hydrolase domain-containing protein [Agrococcus baldri]SFS18500.1 CubicO group peptidase, beta-lactamase class C family [Agrococcus baldri]